jgi:hypothetical protein
LLAKNLTANGYWYKTLFVQRNLNAGKVILLNVVAFLLVIRSFCTIIANSA